MFYLRFWRRIRILKSIYLNLSKKGFSFSIKGRIQSLYLQPIITQYFIDNKSEIWLLFLIAHSKR